MFRNKQPKFAFSCPGSQRPRLAALPIEVFPVKCRTASLPFTGAAGAGRELSRAQRRCGYFIVLQINVTIKNIILEDVSGVITHVASSQLKSR